MSSTERAVSKAPYAASWGYSRAVRVGDRVEVSGTSATKPDGSPHAPGDPYEQTRFVLEIIRGALADVGASMEDVVCTRAFLKRIEDWREVGRAHLEAFGEILPASTCVAGIDLMQPELVVELEAVAVIGAGRGAGAN